ncbi:MAG: STAS domain-containing protein [Candidatus Aminicenantes bacterium]|jgi:anti-sigma B factor antagonist
MKLDVIRKDGILIITPKVKRIDASIATDLKSKLIDFLENGDKVIVINLSEVDFIDSSGLGAMVLILRKIGTDGRIKLCKLKESVRSIFELTRLDKVFEIHKSEEGALESLRTD